MKNVILIAILDLNQNRGGSKPTATIVASDMLLLPSSEYMLTIYNLKYSDVPFQLSDNLEYKEFCNLNNECVYPSFSLNDSNNNIISTEMADWDADCNYSDDKWAIICNYKIISDSLLEKYSILPLEKELRQTDIFAPILAIKNDDNTFKIVDPKNEYYEIEYKSDGTLEKDYYAFDNYYLGENYSESYVYKNITSEIKDKLNNLEDEETSTIELEDNASNKNILNIKKVYVSDDLEETSNGVCSEDDKADIPSINYNFANRENESEYIDVFYEDRIWYQDGNIYYYTRDNDGKLIVNNFKTHNIAIGSVDRYSMEFTLVDQNNDGVTNIVPGVYKLEIEVRNDCSENLTMTKAVIGIKVQCNDMAIINGYIGSDVPQFFNGDYQIISDNSGHIEGLLVNELTYYACE